MKNKISVSVIMAVYNAMPYLEQAVETVLSQTLRDIEFICVDDGSTDGSLEKLREYAKANPRMRVLRHREQTDGAGAARNLGLEAATGKYLSILDADDFFAPDMLEKAYAKAEATEADIVFFDAWKVDAATGAVYEEGSVFVPSRLPKEAVFSGVQNARNLFHMTNGAAWNKLFRREFIEREAFRFESFHHADDIGFVLPALAAAQRIASLPERLLYYRFELPSSQTKRIEKWPDSGYRALLSLKETLGKRGFFPQFQVAFAEFVLRHQGYFLGEINDVAAYEKLYNNLRNGVLKKLGALDVVDEDMDSWCIRLRETIMTLSPMEALLQRCHEHKVENATFSYVLSASIGKVDAPIAIYGAGDYGRQVFSELIRSSDYPIAAWCDQNYAAIGYPVQSPEVLKNVNFSYVVVTPRMPRIYHAIRKMLMDMGIAEEKILWADALERGEEGRISKL